MCCVRTYKWIKWALDVAASRDFGMHLQHPQVRALSLNLASWVLDVCVKSRTQFPSYWQADPRSDMHMPLSDFNLAKTREGESGSEEENLRKAFIREVRSCPELIFLATTKACMHYGLDCHRNCTMLCNTAGCLGGRFRLDARTPDA